MTIYTDKYQIVEEGFDNIYRKFDMLGYKVQQASTTYGTLGKSVEETTKRMQGQHGITGRLNIGLSETIKTGMLMSIGWQAINTVMTTGMEIANRMITGYIELEASLKSIEVVARATGRSYGEVMYLMEKNTDEFMSMTALAPGVMRLLSTSLTTEQMDKFIQAVKDGSAAMGYQAAEQLPLITRGFKQLTANILDNIGVTVYLSKIRRSAATELGISVDALTEAQIHQELYNEMIAQTSKYTGLYEAQTTTAAGAIAGLTTEFTKLTEAISKGNIPIIKEFVGGLTYVVQSMRIVSESFEGMEKYNLGFVSGVYNTIQTFDDFIPLLAEYSLIMQEGKGSTKEYNYYLQMLADISGKTTEEIQKLVEEQKTELKMSLALTQTGEDFADTIQLMYGNISEWSNEVAKTKPILDNVSKSTRDMLKNMFPTIDAYTTFDDVLGITENKLGLLPKALKEAQEAYTYHEKALNENETAIRDANDEIAYMTSGLVRMEDELGNITYTYDENYMSLDKLTEQIDVFTRGTDDAIMGISGFTHSLEASGQLIKSYQSQIEELQRALHPESFDTLADKYSDAKRELEDLPAQIDRAREAQEKASQAVKEKRVEPSVFVRLLEDEATAREELARLEGEYATKQEEELTLRQQVEAEISNLTTKLNEEQSYYDIIKGKVEDLTAAKNTLNETVQTQRNNIDAWNRENVYHREQIGLNKDKIADLGDTIDITTKSLQDFTTELEKERIINISVNVKAETAKRELDDVISKIQTINNIMGGGYKIGTPGSFLSWGLEFIKNLVKGKAQFGIPNVPEAGLYMLHPNERVLTASENRSYTNNNSSSVMNFSNGAIIIQAGNRSGEDLLREISSAAMYQLNRRS
jgi:hypothetical protein